jgi:hypothetical protein
MLRRHGEQPFSGPDYGRRDEVLEDHVKRKEVMREPCSFVEGEVVIKVSDKNKKSLVIIYG